MVSGYQDVLAADVKVELRDQSIQHEDLRSNALNSMEDELDEAPGAELDMQQEKLH